MQEIVSRRYDDFEYDKDIEATVSPRLGSILINYSIMLEIDFSVRYVPFKIAACRKMQVHHGKRVFLYQLFDDVQCKQCSKMK